MMKIQGGCYCGELRYQADVESPVTFQCHCRECQFISGGGPNYGLYIPSETFTYIKGSPKAFTRTDIEAPVTREFCENCGTAILSRLQIPMITLKVGTLDNPSIFEQAQVAVFTCDKQKFHMIPEGTIVYERLPE